MKITSLKLVLALAMLIGVQSFAAEQFQANGLVGNVTVILEKERSAKVFEDGFVYQLTYNGPLSKTRKCRCEIYENQTNQLLVEYDPQTGERIGAEFSLR